MKDNVIYVGNKAFMNYVSGVVIQFTTLNASEVIIKARGKYVSKAVDIAEASSKKFLKNIAKVVDVSIDSKEFAKNDGTDNIRVSSIEIKLKK